MKELPAERKEGAKSLYLDADVWLNLIQREMAGFVPAFQRTKQLLSKAETEKWELVVSDLVKEEVRSQGVKEEDMKRQISGLREKKLVKHAQVKEADREKAREILRSRGLHFSDALHVAVALRKGSHLVTRNMRHFSVVDDLLEVSRPESLLQGPEVAYKSTEDK